MMHEAFEASPPRRAVSPRQVSPPRRAISPRFDRNFSDEYDGQYRDQHREQHRDHNRDHNRDQYREQHRDQLPPFREEASFDRRYRHESLERNDSSDKFTEDVPYRRRYVAETKPSNRSIDKIDDRRFGKLQRGLSEGSLKAADTSPKDRFNVAKEKFMNLERERFNRELQQHMALRRSRLERNSRSTSSPEEERRDERPERHREGSRRDPERSLVERHREPERRKEERIVDEPIRREVERLPRVGRKRDDMKRFEYGAENFMNRVEPKPHREDFDRYNRRELDRRIDEDEIIEPVIDDRRRDWHANDRQRAFSRSRLLDEHRQSYAEGDRERFYERDFRDFHDLADRQPAAKFRHSYAEPIPRGRLGAVRPY